MAGTFDKEIKSSIKENRPSRDGADTALSAMAEIIRRQEARDKRIQDELTEKKKRNSVGGLAKRAGEGITSMIDKIAGDK